MEKMLPTRAVAMMSAFLFLGLSGCAAPGTPPRLRTRSQETATLMLRLPVAPVGRRLQAIELSSKVRISIDARDMESPVVRDLDLATASGTIAVDDVPVGEMRVLTLEYMDAVGSAPIGLAYGAYKDVIAGVNRLALSDVSTVYSQVYMNWMRGLSQDETVRPDPAVIETVVDDTLQKFEVPTPRLLNAQAIAVALADGKVTAKNLPLLPQQEWVLSAGSVLVGVQDVPTGLALEFRVNDLISAPVVSTRGEPVLIGPIAPREAPYKLVVRPLGAGLGPDLQPLLLDVSVSQARPVQRFPSVVLAKSAVGDPLPEEIGPDRGDWGGGMGVGIGDARDNLWALGGWIQPLTNPASLDAVSPQPRLRPAARALRYTRANKWTVANPLPATFPRWGAGVVPHGQGVFVFGGQLDGVGSNKVFHLNAATPEVAAVQVASAAFPVSECVAAKVGEKIYVAGGYQTVYLPDDVTENRAFIETWVFNPATRVFETARTGETGVLASPASAVVNNVWYTFGGWGEGGVQAQVRSFDGTTWSSRAPMPTARSHAAAVVLDGKIWVIGGEEKRSVPSRAVEVYDPATDTWMRRAPLRHPRTLPTCGVVNNSAGQSRIIVAGGVSGVDALVYGLPLRRDTVEELLP